MRNGSFISLVAIALTVYGLVNYFILRRGWQALRGFSSLRLAYLIVIIIMALSYPLARSMPQTIRENLPPAISGGGAFYLALMFYLFLLLLVRDLIRLLGRLFHFYPFYPVSSFSAESRLSFWSFALIVLLAFVIVLIGHINSLYPRLRCYEIRLGKPAPSLQTLRIVVASDLHLGSVVRQDRLKKVVAMINSLEPDLILLPGDMMDEAATPTQARAAAPIFCSLRAKFGLFAVPGNHETYSRQEKRLEEITAGHIRVLCDEAVSCEGIFVVAGRRDRAVESRGGRRANLDSLLQGVDRNLPLFLLDHQPLHLEEAEQAGVDLQVSGHTHAGQLFPLNWINRRVYEKNWGYYRRGNTHYYISCGVGTWGPPVQTAAFPEIVLLAIRFSGG